METNLYCCIPTGHTNSEKTMEDGNIVTTKDDRNVSAPMGSLYSDRGSKLTANGHDSGDEPASPSPEPRAPAEPPRDEPPTKRINPLRIHLGKRPFVDNSPPYYNTSKKKKTNRSSDTTTPLVSRAPKPIPKRKLHNVTSLRDSLLESERDKPVPRLVPKSQLLQFQKGKSEMGCHMKDTTKNLGLQPMVKFKCRKCCIMSFKTLAMLKEHQLVCRPQAKEPEASPEVAPSIEPSSVSGPSRVTRKVYLCSACGTYYENWNLFLHMREVHNRHICLFCLGMFSKAEKLSVHLTNKHNVQEFTYNTKEDFCNVYGGSLYLMCCVCEEICSEKDDFFNHDCNNVKPKPVPVLVSKNAVKPNNAKSVTNGPTTVKKPPEPVRHKKDMLTQPEALLQPQKAPTVANETEQFRSDLTPEMMGRDRSCQPVSSTQLDRSILKEALSKLPPSQDQMKIMPNGDESLEHMMEGDSPKQASPVRELPLPSAPFYPPADKEREGGLKLKLSLNNAKSPVIINSTVDPTIGIQHLSKPPTRNRRPPKRYEKDKLLEPPAQTLPRMPNIKMTICDKADNSFVKATIFENSQDTLLKGLLNNNLETVQKTPNFKPDNKIKSTIYDNKIDDENSLNRVPKLTVRVPKELLDKDSSSDYSSDSDLSDKLTMAENNTTTAELDKPVEEPTPEVLADLQPAVIEPPPPIEELKEEPSATEELVQTTEDTVVEPKTEPMEQDTTVETTVEELPVVEEAPVTELTLDRPLDKYPLKELLRVFLNCTVFNCIYCNHVRKIAVNCEQLCLHMAAEHRFRATVDSITAEELMPETIAAKVKASAPELREIYINLNYYDSEKKFEEVKNDHIFECFQCYFKTAVHKDLYSHNRKMHQKTILLCVMCKSNFYSYSELLCHLCPGSYDSEYEVKFRCCYCNVDTIPSSFRLMVHLRKIHHTCDVCLELCHNQARLSNHVWKHKLHHLCYRCGIAYRNKPDITNHLFWKHGTQSVLCKRCLQKKWPHVYHFCTPPAIFACDECNLQFTRAVYLKVHKRFHSNEFPHACTEEGCTEKFVSKKLLAKHLDDHRMKLLTVDLTAEKPPASGDTATESTEKPIQIIDLVNDDKPAEAGSSEVKAEAGTEQLSKKAKKKKLKDKEALLMDVNLPELNLSESDSSDESDSGAPPTSKEEKIDVKEPPADDKQLKEEATPIDAKIDTIQSQTDTEAPKSPKPEEPVAKLEEKGEEEKKEQVGEKPEELEEKPDEKQVLEIWDNFKKYQEKVEKPAEEALIEEKPKEKTPPLVPIKKHVCDSDHDYCLIPTDYNGDEDPFNLDKKKNKKGSKKKHAEFSSSSSSSSDSDSSCSCGADCSCSSSSGSSSSSSDSDSSDDSGRDKKKAKQLRKKQSKRRLSNGSNVDVMGAADTPILIPEPTEPPVAETDLETDESDTDEEFYDQHPQKVANKLFAEKRNQLMLLASVAPSDGGSMSGEASRPATPAKEGMESKLVMDITEKISSSKKKSKKKKKSKSSKKHGPIKINIPKDVIGKSEVDASLPPHAPNKITISLHSNTVHMPEAPVAPITTPITHPLAATSAENKRSSKRRRVPNKFYGYSSDEDGPQPTTTALKPTLPPKLEWRKEDLPSPVTHRPKKEIASTVLANRLFSSYSESIRLTAPIPDPEPPRILMNTESMESSDSDSSDTGMESGGGGSAHAPIPPPSYLMSGTSSLPYAFQRPAVRQAREGESVYCYCRCPYDEVSEMIACDAEGCPIEWFHFECVGIMVPPKGKWYCPECRKNQSLSGYR